MNLKLKQWGATLVVFGGASLVLPLLGIQLRIFNLFGPNQKAVGVAAIVVGGALWLIGIGAKGFGKGASATSAPAGSTGSGVPPPIPGISTAPTSSICPKCGAKASPTDRFCMECGGPLSPPVVPTPATPVSVGTAAKPKSKAKIGCLIFVVLFLGLLAWFFFAPSKSSTSTARTEPALPSHMAGTLTEFPVDPQAKDPLQPTSVVSQNFSSGTSSGASNPPLQTPADTLPPGVNSSAIPQVATGMTSATYRDPNSGSAPVNVHVLGGANVAAGSSIAQGIAQSAGGSMQGVRVQSPQGQTYDGYSVQTTTIMVYILINRPARNIIILYTPQAQGFPAIKRLASSVGNGRGLRDYPQLVDTYGALPANPPPGYVITSLRTFSGGDLRTTLMQGEAQMGKEAVAAVGRILEVVRLLIPERGTMALYSNARGEEKGVVIGSYGNGRKAAVAWRALAWTVGWGMKKSTTPGLDGLVMDDRSARIMLFHKGPYLGMVKVPGGASEQELGELARMVQL